MKLKNLWIMRHGLAENKFETDFSRPLSAIGKAQALEVATLLIQNERVLPSKMLVSPFQRTQQTADIVFEKLALKAPYETEDLLVHFADPQILGDYLLASGYDNLIIISHMPIVAELCQYLSPGCNIYGFQTAQLVKLEFNEQGTANVTNIYTAN